MKYFVLFFLLILSVFVYSEEINLEKKEDKKMNLIVVAMLSEGKHLVDILDLKQVDENTYVNDKNVLIIGGYGKVNAAIATQKGLDKYNIGRVINYGFVGSMTEKLKIGDYVIPQETFQHDFDLTPLGAKPYEVLEQDKSVFDIDEEMKNKIISVHSNIKTCQYCLTGDKFMTEKILGFDDVICDMECYSVGRVAWTKKVPFVSIKLVSDSVCKDGQNDFFASIEKWSRELQEYVADLIGLL